MFGWLLTISLLFSAVIGVLALISVIIGANLYDFSVVNKKRQWLLNPHARRYKNRRLVSVIVTTRNDQFDIENCLMNVLRSNYRKFEILIIDMASEDQTVTRVKQLIDRYPKRKIKLIVKRSAAAGTLAAALSGYQEYCSGELVLMLEPSASIDKYALKNIVRHYNTDPTIALIQPKLTVGPLVSTAGLVQKYQTLLSYMPRKLSSISNSDYALSDSLIFRRDIFLMLLKQVVKTKQTSLTLMRPANKQVRTYFANDVIVQTKPVPSFQRLLMYTYQMQLKRMRSLYHQRQLFFSRNQEYTKFLTWVRLPFTICNSLVGLLMPWLLTYFLFMAIALHEPTFLVITGALLSALLVYVIWGDEHLHWREKATYSLGIPITYAVFYVLSLVQFFVVLQSLFDN